MSEQETIQALKDELNQLYKQSEEMYVIYKEKEDELERMRGLYSSAMEKLHSAYEEIDKMKIPIFGILRRVVWR